MSEPIVVSVMAHSSELCTLVLVTNHLPEELRHLGWLSEATKHRQGLASYLFPELTNTLFLPGSTVGKDRKALTITEEDAIMCYKTIHLYNKETGRTEFPKEMNIQPIADGAVVLY